MTIATGQKALAADVVAALAATKNVAASGHFYADLGAAVTRYGDRLFVGAATDDQAKADRSQTTDWLSAVMSRDQHRRLCGLGRDDCLDLAVRHDGRSGSITDVRRTGQYHDAWLHAVQHWHRLMGDR